MNTPRYARQIRLPQVGSAGQERIAKSDVSVWGSDGAIVECEYLHRAGVERLSLSPRLEPEPFAHEAFFHFAASRRVAAGAWRAERKLCRLLGLGEERKNGR